MAEPLVSAIIPSYNRAPVLVRAINSVLSQTYSNTEVIIVDNGSNDGTDDIIQALENPDITYHRYTANQSAAASRNFGAEVARGTYLAFLDSDDEWHSDHLETSLRLLNENSDQKGSMGAFYTSRRNQLRRLPVTDYDATTNITNYILGLGGDARTSTFVVDAESFRRVCFDERLSKHQDWDFAIRFGSKFGWAWRNYPTVTMHVDGLDRMSQSMRHDATAYFLSKHGREVSPIVRARFHARLARWTAKFEGYNAEFGHYVLSALPRAWDPKVFMYLVRAVMRI